MCVQPLDPDDVVEEGDYQYLDPDDDGEDEKCDRFADDCMEHNIDPRDHYAQAQLWLAQDKEQFGDK